MADISSRCIGIIPRKEFKDEEERAVALKKIEGLERTDKHKKLIQGCDICFTTYIEVIGKIDRRETPYDVLIAFRIKDDEHNTINNIYVATYYLRFRKLPTITIIPFNKFHEEYMIKNGLQSREDVRLKEECIDILIHQERVPHQPNIMGIVITDSRDLTFLFNIARDIIKGPDRYLKDPTEGYLIRVDNQKQFRNFPPDYTESGI